MLMMMVWHIFTWTNFKQNDLKEGIANNLKMHTLLTKLLTLKGFCKGLSLALQPPPAADVDGNSIH